MTALAALVAGVACLAIIALVSRLRRSAPVEPRDVGFAELEAAVLAAGSPAEVLEHVVAGCRELFAASRAIVFRLHDDAWRAVSGDAEGEVPELLASPMAWFAHNPNLVTAGELGGARFGAIGPALEKLFSYYEINAAMPLVDRRLVVAVIGLALPPLSPSARTGLERLRGFSGAACANLRLHAEAAHAINLDREASDLEGIQMALVPEPPGGETEVAEYASHRRVAGEVGSDFALVRPGDGELWIAVGDAVGSGLAAALIAAAVKGALDSSLADGPPGADALLAFANLSLDRPASPARASCVCARVTGGALEWASAGHVSPYLVRGDQLRALVAAGPLLGEVGPIARNRTPLESGDCLVFLTNGVIDAIGEGDDQRGHRRIQRLLIEAGPAAPGALLAAIAEAVAERCPQPRDDETAVVVRVS